MGSQRGAHCGPLSPPRGTICSLSMHHLLVWAVAGATGGGGLRSECVSIPDAAAGAGQALIRHPSPGTRPLGGGGLRPPWRALPLASALWALQSPLAASTPGGGWSPEEQRAKRLALRTHPVIGEPRPPRLPGAAPGKSQALHRASPRRTARSLLQGSCWPCRVTGGAAQRGSELPAVSGQPQWGQHLG